MKSKYFITSLLLCVINITAYSQFDNFNSFEELNSLAIEYYQKNNFDSLIIIDEYARIRFPEHDEGLTYMLSFLYNKTKQDSKVLENWDYGLKKRYFFGINAREYKQFENNPEFSKLVKIDKQIGDSLNHLAHVEFEIVLPTDYSTDKVYPVLFVFHGNNRNLQQAKSIWTSAVIQDKFIAVYLQSCIHMSKSAYQWKLNDEKTNKEFEEIYERIVKEYPVSKDNVIFSGMSAGGRLAIDYVFKQFVAVNGLVLNCPVIPNIPDSSLNKFVDENKKIAIITGENDWALIKQKDLINKVDSTEGNSKITVNPGIGHQFSKDFSTLLDEYLNWILE